MSNYLLLVSLHVNFSARKSSLEKSQRVADHTMQRGSVRPLCIVGVKIVRISERN